jgi:poly(A) polymerase
VRFIGAPEKRIAEDYLRILRFFRFHARYGHGAPDQAGLAACIAGRGGLEQLSRERVRMELLKLLAAPRAAATLEAMAETGILVSVLGGVPLIASFADMVAVEAVIGIPGDPVRRLGALAVFVAEDGERLSQRLRLSNIEHARLAAMGDGWWRLRPAIGDEGVRALLYRLGAEKFTDRALLAWARASVEAGNADWRALATFPDRWIVPVFPLKAADFIARGVGKGPALGAAMQAAEDAWIAADFPSDAGKIAAIADAAVVTARA